MPLINTNFAGVITFSRASGATWFNSAGNLIGVDFSTTSNTIGTGSKTFTLDATAGVVRDWATGDTVLISDQSNSSNNMTGTVTSYTASTQVLVVNVTSTAGSGTITSWRIGNLMQRLDYNPATLAAQGLLIEEQRTNSIRNNTMQGAVAGTPGTAPTNWGVTGTANGLTRTISTGTENGITYIDVRYAGTTTAASFCLVRPEAVNQVVAASGQSWTSSLYMRVAAGSTANITALENWIIGADAGGAITESNQVTPVITGTMTRFTVSRTMNNASTAFVYPYVAFTFNSGVAIDITLRIGLPQLELGAFATSVIPTTTTALTRNADQASVNTLSPWYNASASTLYTEFTSPVPTTVTASAVVAGYDDGTANNRFSNFYVSNTGAVSANQTTGGTPNFTISAASGLTLSNVQKQATRFQAGSYASSANGAAAVTDPFASAPPTVNALRFGLRPSGTQANMWLRRVTVYPRGLSNADLQAITA